MRVFKEAAALVREFFGGDAVKTAEWFTSPNPLLGMITPQQLIDLGRGEKLLKFVKDQLEENKR